MTLTTSTVCDSDTKKPYKTANLISSFQKDNNLTKGLDVDLCLDINKNLQNLLEDTLFKNITLKVGFCVWCFFSIYK